jgi:hypothetical protein
MIVACPTPDPVNLMDRQAIKGFLIAPAIPGLIVLSLSALQGSVYEGIWWLSLFVPISYLTSLLFGYPIYFLLRRLCRDNLFYYVMSGFIVTFIPVFYIILYPLYMNYNASPSSSGLSRVDYTIIGIMVLSGLTVSATFWFIVRPDKLRQQNR